MITIKKRNAVPRAELTCRGCGSILEYGNEDLVEFVTATVHYSIDNNGYLSRNYKLKCPVCNIEQPASWIQRQKIVSAPQTPSTNEELVDLGLPSGTLWMKTNLGAESETDFGLFYQWGDTKGYKGFSKHQFDWNGYKYGSWKSLTKYNNTDDKLVLNNDDDPLWIATEGKFKIPTKEQLEELRDHTNHEWIEIDGVKGMKFTNKSDDTKYIFIPAAGSCYDSYHYGVGSWGYVWSSSRNSSDPSGAWRMYFDLGDVSMRYDYRRYGYSVRGVVVPQIETFDEIDDTDDGTPVDLGLPSGTLWQKSNLGASKPSDFGLFYQWGDTQGYVGDAGHGFNWSTYKHGTSLYNITKYNNTDGKLVLDDEDDPVYTATEGHYKTPSEEQLRELMNNTNHQWVRLANGVNGMKFINKNDSTKYIFIPAGGCCFGPYHNDINGSSFLWSSSRDSGDPNLAWSMYFCSGNVYIYNYDRYSGFNVRGVANELLK